MPRRPALPRDVAATRRARGRAVLGGAGVALGFAVAYVALAQASAWGSGAADIVPFWPLSGVMLGLAAGPTGGSGAPSPS